jgi:dCTP deaminase
VKQPVKVYKGMPIGQLIYFLVEGETEIKYNQKKNAKYSGQPDKPIESMMWKNKF